MTEPQAITEADGVHLQWYEDAKQQTAETLPEFIRHLLEDYTHDYGTICHATAAAAVGAASAIEHSPQGGITGLQGEVVMWAFMEHWNGIKRPARLLRYENLLYPQFAHTFTSVSVDTWKWAQEEARRLLDEDQSKSERELRAVPRVRDHWRSIVNGVVPFGLRVAQR